MTNLVKPGTWVDPSNEVAIYHFEAPEAKGEGKHASARLGKTTQADLRVQIFESGGENNLHSHVTNDGHWFVLSGRVRFYTVDDVLVADLGENEGFVTPRGYKYWFEAVPEAGMLQLARFGVSTKPILNDEVHKADRINHAPAKAGRLRLVQQRVEVS